MTLNNLETPKIESFSVFLRFSATVHALRVNCDKMAGDGLDQDILRTGTAKDDARLAFHELCSSYLFRFFSFRFISV